MRARLLAIWSLLLLSTGCTGTSSSISVTAPTTDKCQVALENAANAAAPADGMSGSLAINTNRDCTWKAISNAAWLTITSAASGQGSETLTYRVSANAEPAQRRAVLEVNSTQATVVQEAAPCRFTVSPSSTTVSAVGGEVAVSVETLTGCPWAVSSSAAWIRFRQMRTATAPNADVDRCAKHGNGRGPEASPSVRRRLRFSRRRRRRTPIRRCQARRRHPRPRRRRRRHRFRLHRRHRLRRPHQRRLQRPHRRRHRRQHRRRHRPQRRPRRRASTTSHRRATASARMNRMVRSR